MKRNSPARKRRSDPKDQESDVPQFLRGKWMPISAGLILLVLVSIWLVPRGPAASIPPINLEGLDPRVAKTIQNGIEEIRAHPRSAKAWGGLGSLLQSYRILDSAKICLTEAERLDQHDPRWPYLQSVLLATASPAESLVKLRRTVELCGNQPQAPRWRLATLLAEQGKWDDVEQETGELLRDDPSFTPAILLNARRVQARGSIDEAIALAQRCERDSRTARSAAVLLANLYLRQGNTNSAAETQRKIVSLPPDQPVADPYLSEAAKRRTDPRLLTEQTHPLLAAGRLQEAELMIQQLVAEHAEYPETWLLAGRLQILKRDFSTAEKSLRHHLELDQHSVQGIFQLGLAQLGREQFAEAAATFAKATQLKPDFGPAFYNRGFALTKVGNLPDATSAFRQAIRNNPDRIDSYLMLADTQLRLGETEQALEVLRQAAALDPTNAGLRQLRAKADRQR